MQRQRKKDMLVEPKKQLNDSSVWCKNCEKPSDACLRESFVTVLQMEHGSKARG